MTFDRRTTPRRRVLFAAHYRPLGSADRSECMIRNVTSRGAAVRVAASAPAFFELMVDRDGTAKAARTVWRAGDLRGVSFDQLSAGRIAPKLRRTPLAELRMAVGFTVAE